MSNIICGTLANRSTADLMAELDHIVFACADVADGTRIIQELTGATAIVGGPHVGRGTHNTLLTFDDRPYFEIFGIDPDQAEPERPRGFGLDDLDGPKLVGYAVHTVGDETLDDIAATISGAGFDPGTHLAMSRMKPDGHLLEWELTTGGDTGHGMDGALPFAIDWLGGPSPASSLPSMGSLVKLSVRNPDARVAGVIAGLGLNDTVDFSVGPAQLTVTIETPNGIIKLT
jgi:hypothetical protein